MKHQVASRIAEGPFRYQAWPTITRAKDGTLFLGTSGHRLDHICPFGKNIMYVSKDEGESWSCPVIINDTWMDDRDAGMLAYDKNKLLLTYFNNNYERFYDWEKVVDTHPHYAVATPLALGMRKEWESLAPELRQVGSFSKISYDGGKTWSPSRPAPVSSPHGPCLLADGSLLWIGSHNKIFGAEIKDNNAIDGGCVDTANSIYCCRSTDDGATWQMLSKVIEPEGLVGERCEPHCIQMSNGDVLGVVRYHTGRGAGDRTMYTVVSHDGGKTWQDPTMLGVWGCPGHLLQHSSGAVVLVYGKRKDVMGQYVIVSRDFGKTWSQEKLISPPAPDWDNGYPSSVELSNGDILTAFYQKCEGDKFNSLHTTRFSLDEVL